MKSVKCNQSGQRRLHRQHCIHAASLSAQFGFIAQIFLFGCLNYIYQIPVHTSRAAELAHMCTRRRTKMSHSVIRKWVVSVNCLLYLRMFA